MHKFILRGILERVLHQGVLLDALVSWEVLFTLVVDVLDHWEIGSGLVEALFTHAGH